MSQTTISIILLAVACVCNSVSILSLHKDYKRLHSYWLDNKDLPF